MEPLAVTVVSLMYLMGIFFYKEQNPEGWGAIGGEETQWVIPPQTLSHGPFPLQQEALPDETEVIEDPTTEVGDSAPPHPIPPTALGRASPKHEGAGAMRGMLCPWDLVLSSLCTPSRNNDLFCRSLWGPTPSRWRWESLRNPQRM